MSFFDPLGQFISNVLAIHEEPQAKQFVEEYSNWLEERFPLQPHKKVLQENIGWCFGEGMTQSQVDMWISVCGAYHPVFGQKIPSLHEAFQFGVELGKEIVKSIEESNECLKH